MLGAKLLSKLLLDQDLGAKQHIISSVLILLLLIEHRLLWLVWFFAQIHQQWCI